MHTHFIVGLYDPPHFAGKSGSTGPVKVRDQQFPVTEIIMISSPVRRLTWFLSFMVITGLCGGAVRDLNADPSIPLKQGKRSGKRFSIGYLLDGTDFGNTENLFESLKHYIWNQSNIRKAFQEEGYDEIILSRCDGHRHMVQQLNADEFDLAFATAVIYAWQQNKAYLEPLLVTQRPGDLIQPNREVGVSRRGVVIYGPGCQLFTRKDMNEKELIKLLKESPLAVPSFYSAAGYIFPQIKMGRDMGNISPGETWFCGSDTEVVEHVITGLVPFGACREGALKQVLQENKLDSYCTIWWQTKPFPTDPVLLHARHKPESSRLGTELKVGLREFFNTGRRLPGLKLIDIEDERDYVRLSNDLADLLKGEEPFKLPSWGEDSAGSDVIHQDMIPNPAKISPAGKTDETGKGDDRMDHQPGSEQDDQPAKSRPAPVIPDDEFSYFLPLNPLKDSPWAG
jgi:ABC-type phosphate/phosphonate transport system substrate-binding protein